MVEAVSVGGVVGAAVPADPDAAAGQLQPPCQPAGPAAQPAERTADGPRCTPAATWRGRAA